jgi:hypothetical protein
MTCVPCESDPALVMPLPHLATTATRQLTALRNFDVSIAMRVSV